MTVEVLPLLLALSAGVRLFVAIPKVRPAARWYLQAIRGYWARIRVAARRGLYRIKSQLLR